MSPRKTCLKIIFSEDDLKTKLDNLRREKRKCQAEYNEWQANCEEWRKSHGNHPNKALFEKYNNEVSSSVIRSENKIYLDVFKSNSETFNFDPLSLFQQFFKLFFCIVLFDFFHSKNTGPKTLHIPFTLFQFLVPLLSDFGFNLLMNSQHV